MTLEEVVAKLAESAKHILEDCHAKGEDFVHVAFPLQIGEEKVGMSTLHLSGDKEERRIQVSAIHRNLEANDCNALVIITDAWRRILPEGVTPDDYLKRREMGEDSWPKTESLFILIVGKDHPAQSRSLPYTRQPNGKIEWGKSEEYDQFESWMVPPQWRHNVAKGSA